MQEIFWSFKKECRDLSCCFGWKWKDALALSGIKMRNIKRRSGKSNNVCMDSFEIKLKMRGLFIKLWKLPVSSWQALNEGKMLLFKVTYCHPWLCHTQSRMGNLQQAGSGSWGITSCVRNGCWPVRTSVWADAKLLVLVLLLWHLGKVWFKIPACFVVISNCSSTFYSSVCQCFTINSLCFPGIWLGCKNSLLANMWHKKSVHISDCIQSGFNYSPAPYSSKMVLQWRRLLNVYPDVASNSTLDSLFTHHLQNQISHN